jgi:ubiquinone/menaquinone biosynthesis C-methylase UbiE
LKSFRHFTSTQMYARIHATSCISNKVQYLPGETRTYPTWHSGQRNSEVFFTALTVELETEIKTGIQRYWHERSATYDRYPACHSDEAEKLAYQRVLKMRLNGNSLNILDVGTGTGFMALILAKLGYRVTGLDFAEGMIARAQKVADQEGQRVAFQVGDAGHLPFPDASFDVVICRYLLWTLPDPQQVLQEWVRVIKPGGKIIAIEGKWKTRSLKSWAKRLSRQMGILIYEKTNPRKLGYDTVIQSKLPFNNGLSAKEATCLFLAQGLGNISVEVLHEIRDVQVRNMSFFYRAALPPPTFLISGERL